MCFGYLPCEKLLCNVNVFGAKSEDFGLNIVNIVSRTTCCEVVQAETSQGVH